MRRVSWKFISVDPSLLNRVYKYKKFIIHDVSTKFIVFRIRRRDVIFKTLIYNRFKIRYARSLLRYTLGPSALSRKYKKPHTSISRWMTGIHFGEFYRTRRRPRYRSKANRKRIEKVAKDIEKSKRKQEHDKKEKKRHKAKVMKDIRTKKLRRAKRLYKHGW